MTAAIESSSMRIVAGLKCAPVGFCIQAFAIRIHSADRLLPIATSQVTTRCCTAAQPVPAEEEQADERAFEEEGHQALDGERHAEDVADVVRVVRPVRAELELHRDAGGDAHREIDAEQDSPEARHVAPDRPPGHDVDAFHDRHEDRKARASAARTGSGTSRSPQTAGATGRPDSAGSLGIPSPHVADQRLGGRGCVGGWMGGWAEEEHVYRQQQQCLHGQCADYVARQPRGACGHCDVICGDGHGRWAPTLRRNDRSRLGIAQVCNSHIEMFAARLDVTQTGRRRAGDRAA